MIHPNTTFSKGSPDHFRTKQEISKVLSAAVVNSHFRNQLLRNPVQAVSGGYSGEKFELGVEERKRLGTIRAHSLAEFAAQLNTI